MQAEGRGWLPDLGEFRPDPPLLSGGDWSQIWNLVNGRADDLGRTGPEALQEQLRGQALSAALVAILGEHGQFPLGRSDEEWYELATQRCREIRRLVTESRRAASEEEYRALRHAMRAEYARLAALLLVWARTIEIREWQRATEGVVT